MSSITDTLGNAGPGELFGSLGKTWQLSRVGPAVRAEYSAWCRMRARQMLTEDRPGLTPEEYEEDLQRYQSAREAGLYNWGSPLDPDGMGSAVRNIMGSAEGYAQLIAVLLKPHHKEVDVAKAAEIIAGADSAELTEAVKAAMRINPPNG